LSTATVAPTGIESSALVKYRPTTAGASKNLKKLALTVATRISFAAVTHADGEPLTRDAGDE
jgi:hypothetical protein